MAVGALLQESTRKCYLASTNDKALEDPDFLPHPIDKTLRLVGELQSCRQETGATQNIRVKEGTRIPNNGPDLGSLAGQTVTPTPLEAVASREDNHPQGPTEAGQTLAGHDNAISGPQVMPTQEMDKHGSANDNPTLNARQYQGPTSVAEAGSVPSGLDMPMENVNENIDPELLHELLHRNDGQNHGPLDMANPQAHAAPSAMLSAVELANAEAQFTALDAIRGEECASLANSYPYLMAGEFDAVSSYPSPAQTIKSTYDTGMLDNNNPSSNDHMQDYHPGFGIGEEAVDENSAISDTPYNSYIHNPHSPSVAPSHAVVERNQGSSTEKNHTTNVNAHNAFFPVSDTRGAEAIYMDQFLKFSATNGNRTATASPSSQGFAPYQGFALYQGDAPYQGVTSYQGVASYQGVNPYQEVAPYQGITSYQGINLYQNVASYQGAVPNQAFASHQGIDSQGFGFNQAHVSNQAHGFNQTNNIGGTTHPPTDGHARHTRPSTELEGLLASMTNQESMSPNMLHRSRDSGYYSVDEVHSNIAMNQKSDTGPLAVQPQTSADTAPRPL